MTEMTLAGARDALATAVTLGDRVPCQPGARVYAASIRYVEDGFMQVLGVFESEQAALDACGLYAVADMFENMWGPWIPAGVGDALYDMDEAPYRVLFADGIARCGGLPGARVAHANQNEGLGVFEVTPFTVTGPVEAPAAGWGDVFASLAQAGAWAGATVWLSAWHDKDTGSQWRLLGAHPSEDAAMERCVDAAIATLIGFRVGPWRGHADPRLDADGDPVDGSMDTEMAVARDYVYEQMGYEHFLSWAEGPDGHSVFAFLNTSAFDVGACAVSQGMTAGEVSALMGWQG